MSGERWLRNWRTADAAVVLTAHQASDDLVRQTGPIPDLASAERLIGGYKDVNASGAGVVWAVVDADRAVGAVGVTNVNRVHGTGWCWYWIAASARRRGLATAGLLGAADHAFADGLFRLELAHRTENFASRAVAVSAGFVSEGIERSKLHYDGQRFDCETHARLASDPVPDRVGLETRLG